MSQNEFIPKYTHPFTLEEAMLLEIDILVQGKLHLTIYMLNTLSTEILRLSSEADERLG